MHHLHFNHMAVLVAAFLQWILGALWYSLLFVKPWMALTGHKQGERPKGAVFYMILSFFGGLILAFMVAHFVLWSGAATIGEGLFIGFICWLGFVAVPLFFETLYERRPFALFAINSGYWLLSLLISGGLVAMWH
jgi:Protein of unknown function (DUF1761)